MQTFSKFIDSNTKTEAPLDYARYFTENIDLSKYKIPDLKRIARENGLFVSGTKTVLIDRIHRNFTMIRYVIKCQSRARRNAVLSKIRMRGPALKAKDRSKCVNDTDFYTLEPITEIEDSNFFSYKDKQGFIYGFNLKSLAMMLETQGSLTNPYNRDIFDVKTLQYMNMLMEKPKAKSLDEMEFETFNRLRELRNQTPAARIEKLFYEIDCLGNYTSSAWFSRLNREQYIYLFKRMREIWNYRGQMENDIKILICPYFEPFQFRLNRYLGYMNNSRERNLTDEECQKVCIIAFENLIYTGREDTYKNIIVMHILSALTLVSREARTAMPWLYDSIVYLMSL
jgi:hypothetical protein